MVEYDRIIPTTYNTWGTSKIKKKSREREWERETEPRSAEPRKTVTNEFSRSTDKLTQSQISPHSIVKAKRSEWLIPSDWMCAGGGRDWWSRKNKRGRSKAGPRSKKRSFSFVGRVSQFGASCGGKKVVSEFPSPKDWVPTTTSKVVSLLRFCLVRTTGVHVVGVRKEKIFLLTTTIQHTYNLPTVSFRLFIYFSPQLAICPDSCLHVCWPHCRRIQAASK